MTNKYEDELLNYAIPAQKKFSRMYQRDDLGLLSLSEDYIQVTQEKFIDLVNKIQPAEVFSKKFEGQYYLRFAFGGTEIHAVFSASDFASSGLITTEI